MNEKQQIERATVDAFVAMHNEIYGTSYSICEYGDTPDAVCISEESDILNVEVCITEDRVGDIPWALGKTENRPYQGELGSCLSGNVLAELSKRLIKKSLMRYGGHTALVIRDSSGVDWDWELIQQDVRDYIHQCKNCFDMGIWIINSAKTRLQRID